MRKLKPSIILIGCVLPIFATLIFLHHAPHIRPLTLSFLGYTNDGTGASMALFCLSNQSAFSVSYVGDGPVPDYYLIQRLSNHGTTRNITATSLHWQYKSGPTRQMLAHEASVTFPVAIPAGASGLVVGVSYFPPRSRLYHFIQGLKLRLGIMGRWLDHSEVVELEQPFK